MNLQNFKITLPKTWRELSRLGSADQVNIRLCHISPLAGIDPKMFQDEALSSGSSANVARIAILTPNTRPLQDFYDGMKGFIASGFAPPEMNMAYLDDLWNKMTKSPGAEWPGESDFSTDLNITQFQDEAVAEQSFKNQGLFPTQGFNVPIPGRADKMTFNQLLESDILKNYLSKDQAKQMEKMKEALAQAKKQMPKVREGLAKSGVAHKEGKYLGYPVIYIESQKQGSLSPAPGPKSSSQKSAGGGGYGNLLDPLPKIARTPAGAGPTYMSLLVGNFIVGGGLLWSAASLPTAATPCYSLKQTKRKTETVEKITSIYIVPLPSNFAREGYLNREEAEDILKQVISKLRKN